MITVTVIEAQSGETMDINIKPDHKTTTGCMRVKIGQQTTVGLTPSDYRKVEQMDSAEAIQDYLNTLKPITRKA